MTFLQIKKEMKKGIGRYPEFSGMFFASFLDVEKISKKHIPEKEEEIKQLYSLLVKKLHSPHLTKPEWRDLMDYIEKLQFALETLAIKKGEKNLDDMKKAARHLGKKMQSSAGMTRLVKTVR